MLGGSFQAAGEISLISQVYSQLNRYRDFWLLSLVS